MSATFETLKKRWPEVAVIIALATIPQFLFGNVLRTPLTEAAVKYGIGSRGISWLYGVLYVILGAILICIKAGFMRTAYLHGTQRHRFSELFGQGKHFFRRLLVFTIIWVLIRTLLFMAIAIILARHKSVTQVDALAITPWTVAFPMIIVEIALMKPLLLVPALVIVRDIRLMHAIKSIREYKLFGARELLIFFGIKQAFMFASVFMGQLQGINDILDGSMSLATSIVSQFLVISVALSAVKFVAEKHLPIDTAEQNGIDPL